MATIERFEQIISWQEARILNKNIADLIDGGKFKRSFRLINQIELQKVLNEAEIKGSFNFYIAKAPVGS